MQSALAQLTAEQTDLVLQSSTRSPEQRRPRLSQPEGQAGGASSPRRQHARPAGAYAPLVLAVSHCSSALAAAAILDRAFVRLMQGRRARTMRQRDQISDAVGIPVVASIQSRAPRSVGGWGTLLEGYATDNVEKWTLRQLLRAGHARPPGQPCREPADAHVSPSIVVITLSDDRRAWRSARSSPPSRHPRA